MIITMTKKILWFDIETAPEVNQSEFNTYPKKRLWENKMIEKGITTTFERSYMEKASIYPEFAKVVCISYLVDNQVKSLIGQDEAMLLLEFNDVLALHQQKPKKKRKLLVVCPFSAVQAKVDRLCGELRQPKIPKLEKVHRLYARRKWNGKGQRWEKIYKTYPPRDPYRAWQD